MNDGLHTRLRPMTPDDWPAVSWIYAEGLATGDASFETDPPDWSVWDAGHLKSCRTVAVSGEGREEEVLGWAALSPVSSRCVYGGVGEVSVYVAERARGRGLGRTLLNRLVVESESAGLWTLQAGVFPENRASIRIHERCGFRTVGVRERVGRLAGRWRDTVLMERRSPTVGAD